MSNTLDLAGQRFGKLTVLWRSTNSKAGKSRWMVRCDCGRQAVQVGSDLKSHVTSCFQCRNTKHGMYTTRLYRIWAGMWDRCHRRPEKFKSYAKIFVCDEWKKFETFFDDMGPSYKEHVLRHGEADTSIDRIDNEGGYSKANCRWATRRQQLQNRSRTIFLTHNDQRHSLRIWSDLLGIKYGTLYSRYSRGDRPDRILRAV